MRLLKDDTLTIRINPMLKTKFHIATGFAGISATINTFMSNFVRDYERQYGIIELTLSKKQKYDLITKFFGVKVNKKLMEEFNHQETLDFINENMGTDVTIEEFEFFINNYPKTRNPNVNNLVLAEDRI